MAELNRKIVADSSADMLTMEGFPFASAPLKILTAEKYYVDDAKLDVDAFTDDMLHYDGKSSTACPSPEDWLHAFDNSEEIFCLTISSNLSGSYNAACVAKQTYEEEHPGRRVHVIDSLSTGPEMWLLAQKIRECTERGDDFDSTCETLAKYAKHTHLLFMLESMRNLANNGRVSPIAAKAAGILGIRAIGIASEVGTLQMLSKHRGEKKSIQAMVDYVSEYGHKTGKICISHVGNEPAALRAKELLLEKCPNLAIEVHRCRGLCSFYAEKGGLLIGFEAL